MSLTKSKKYASESCLRQHFLSCHSYWPLRGHICLGLFETWLDPSRQSNLAWPNFDEIPQRPHWRALLVQWRMGVDRGATCCCWPRRIQVYSHSCMDIDEITLKRRYGPASVSDVNTRWRSWFEGFNLRRNRTGMCIKTRPSKVFAVWPFFSCFSPGLFSCLKVGPMICSVGTAATSFTGLGMAVMRVIFCPSLPPHRFSAFWLRSKCSICSYQLNIWYEDHVSSSILNGFLQGMERQELAPVPWRVGLALQYRKDRLTPLTTQSLANQHQMVVSTYIRQWARIILAICNDQVRICHHFYMRQF